ncbi:NAD(P)-dependent dehydrogenase (short-subunit alcohol dehydrogenase family) [Pseudomonas sp. F-14 TE3623]
MTTRIFLITGASKGIGRALAAQLFQAGHHVVGIARNSLDRHFPGTPCRTQALLPGIRNRSWGRIVNISSLTLNGKALLNILT